MTLEERVARALARQYWCGAWLKANEVRPHTAERTMEFKSFVAYADAAWTDFLHEAGRALNG